jgi:hypothetical protein
MFLEKMTQSSERISEVTNNYRNEVAENQNLKSLKVKVL